MQITANPLTSSHFNPHSNNSQSSMQMVHFLQQLLQMLVQMMSMFNPQSGSQGAAPMSAPNFGDQGCSCSQSGNPLQNFLGQNAPLSQGYPQGPMSHQSSPVPNTGYSPTSGYSQPSNQVQAPWQQPTLPGQQPTLPGQQTYNQSGDQSQLAPLQPNTGSSPFNVDSLVNAVSSSRRQAASQHFPNILAECQRQGITDRNQIAYILATAVHESNAGATMEELASGQAYEGRRDLGNTQSGDGRRFKGRGYVQITGRRNYTDWSQRLGMDLVSNPSLATQPSVASRVLVEGMMKGTFTGKGLGEYVGNGRADFHNARRVVNGTDRSGHIAGIAQNLLSAMS